MLPKVFYLLILPRLYLWEYWQMENAIKTQIQFFSLVTFNEIFDILLRSNLFISFL